MADESRPKDLWLPLPPIKYEAEATPIISGCEPYDMDFGDREFSAWLERHLTAGELAEWDALTERERRLLPLRWPKRFWRLWHARRRVRRMVLWPVLWPTRHRLAVLRARAVERGGPPPGPSWKIRTEWGEAKGRE